MNRSVNAVTGNLAVDLAAGLGPGGEGTQSGVQMLTGLGAPGMQNVDQAPLVPWGGPAKPAEELRRTQRLTIRVWSSGQVVDRHFEVYERLPEDMRACIPLKWAWILDVSETG